MFTGQEIAESVVKLGFTHIIWVPDSTRGLWEAALEDSPNLRLVRVCREGEAWPLAAGLLLGGQSPLLMMQCTGLTAIRSIFVTICSVAVKSLVG